MKGGDPGVADLIGKWVSGYGGLRIWREEMELRLSSAGGGRKGL